MHEGLHIKNINDKSLFLKAHMILQNVLFIIKSTFILQEILLRNIKIKREHFYLKKKPFKQQPNTRTKQC